MIGCLHVWKQIIRSRFWRDSTTRVSVGSALVLYDSYLPNVVIYCSGRAETVRRTGWFASPRRLVDRYAQPGGAA